MPHFQRLEGGLPKATVGGIKDHDVSRSTICADGHLDADKTLWIGEQPAVWVLRTGAESKGRCANRDLPEFFHDKGVRGGFVAQAELKRAVGISCRN